MVSELDLIERLKTDGNPSFALDILTAQTLVPDIVVMRRNNDDTANEPFTYRKFTADIGDALWLVETLLPDTYWLFAKSQEIMGQNEVIAEAEHESAPASILLALLYARAALKGGDNAA